MRSVSVVPGEIERQLLLEACEAVRNQDQPSRALGFERAHAALNHRQAPVLSQCPKPMSNSVVTAPAPESLLRELRSLVGDDVGRSIACSPECSLEVSSNRS